MSAKATQSGEAPTDGTTRYEFPRAYEDRDPEIPPADVVEEGDTVTVGYISAQTDVEVEAELDVTKVVETASDTLYWFDGLRGDRLYHCDLGTLYGFDKNDRRYKVGVVTYLEV
jgi:hypothetical protein